MYFVFLLSIQFLMSLRFTCICIWLTISSCCGSIPLILGLIRTDGGLSTLCRCSRFASQQRVLKTFPSPGYLRSEDGVVWLWHLLLNLYIWLTILSCWGSILLTLGLVGRMVVWAPCVIVAGLLVSRWDSLTLTMAFTVKFDIFLISWYYLIVQMVPLIS